MAKLIGVPGFSWGWSGSSGGSLSGFQRDARTRGEAEPKSIEGKRGPGRASSARSYVVSVHRLSDGEWLAETVGPAYWPKKRWQQERADAQKRLLRKLGWSG